MSNYFMTLADRIILSFSSTEAFVAASSAHPILHMNSRAMTAFIVMSNVFIGQFHGAKNYLQISKVVWQTLLTSFLYYIILIPLACNARSFLATTVADLGTPYLSISLLFLPFYFAGFGAIGAFFIGIGQTKIVPAVTLISNLINIFLDIIFIPIWGIRGAAYATGIAQIISFLIFLKSFWQTKYKVQFATHKPRFSLKIFKKIIVVGIPNALNSLINSGGVAVCTQIVAAVSLQEDLLAYSISSSIYAFFWFFLDGLGKGVCTMSANFLGKNQVNNIFKLAKAVILLVGLFALVTAVFMVIFPNVTLKPFHFQSVSPAFLKNFHRMLFWTWLALVADGIRWMLQNTLIAANDVSFTVVSNITCFWLTAAIPVIIFVYHFRIGGAILCWQLFTLDPCCRIISNITRIRSERWQRKAQSISQNVLKI